MDRSKKIAKKRKEREKKRQTGRKAAGISPARLAARAELASCHINGDWADCGQAVAFVVRRHGSPRRDIVATAAAADAIRAA